VLRNEFHDILPGSSIREVYQLAESELSGVVEAGRAVTGARLGEIAGRLAGGGDRPAVLAVNPDLSPRPLRLVSSEKLPGGQAVEGGSVLAGAREVPGLSAAVVVDPAPAEGLSVGEGWLENAQVRVELGKDGTLARVFDKRHGREALADRANQIWAYVDKPRNWDAWDIEEGYARQGEEVIADGPAEVIETGPHRAALRIRRRFRDSAIVQIVRLWANSARIEIATDIDWHERRVLLRARFPLAVRADVATFECAHGVIRRPTHRNTSWDRARFEVAGHRFADLSERGYGVALLNDGKYGHSVEGNVLGLSLLRSPVFPDPHADEGRQSFTYALLPHEGDWLEGGVLAEAEDLNQPMPCRPVRAGGEAEWRAVEVRGLSLGLSALKPAEDGGALILRAYEPAGGRGPADIVLPEGWRLGEAVDLLEEPGGREGSGFLPFELRSWKVEREGS
jgi:alpha-mannosidase